MNKRSVGNRGEDRAYDFLLQNGIDILERNYRFHKTGEIDLIGRDGEYLVFFEVKYREGANKGRASEAVTFAKQRQISKVAVSYLYVKKFPMETPVRFDVIAIDGDEIKWHKNAFEYVG